jgi:hypothetical protein
VPKITWNVQLEDGPHTVELNHGYFSGKRVIQLDGVLVERTHKLWHLLLDVGSSHAFQINDHRFVIDIQINGMTPYYHLAVDGRLIEPTEVAFQVDPLHWLRWLAAISLIIGLLTMTVLELFRQPDHGPLEIVPPALRDPLTCVLGAAIPFGAAGFALVVIIDIYRSSRAKRTGRWALFLLSVAIYVLNMGFWARGVQGYIGLLRTLSLGVPPWSIVVPVLCLASMIALAWRPRGVYILLLPLGFVLLLLGLKLFDMSASLLEAAGLRHGFGAYLSLALSVA